MKKSVNIQRFIALLSLVLFAGKLFAWYLTNSVTVFTDAMESIVNIVAGFLGLFSLNIAAKPRDPSHPNGHGKAEFLSSAVEGTLITIAGFIIIWEAVERLVKPSEIQRLDAGLYIVLASGAINYIVGYFTAIKGEQLKSMVLVSAGNHLKTDAYSGLAIVTGLLLLILTKNQYIWLDSVVALCFALIIVRTGFKVVKRSISGIMDETDMVLLQQVIDLLQKYRSPEWVDIHHLKVLRHSGLMHVDAHLTLPNYFKVSDAEQEIKKLERVIMHEFGNDVEIFIHVEGCNQHQCKLCQMGNCSIRHTPFEQQEKWQLDNIWRKVRHHHPEAPSA
jgi:cation diffusion facilitator family transporter